MPPPRRHAMLFETNMSSIDKIILFHYSYSPYARRITWYLALRGIPYSQCVGQNAVTWRQGANMRSYNHL